MDLRTSLVDALNSLEIGSLPARGSVLVAISSEFAVVTIVKCSDSN